jgi:putative transposase
MDEETLRKMAIEQHLQGKEPVSIYKELGRTKPWFFKWLNRYQSGDPHWFQDQSRAPHASPRKTTPTLHNLITNIRIQLEENPYAQIGVSAIRWECTKQGITPPPDRTINRILKRANLLKKNSLPTQRSGISLFPRTAGVQQPPSRRPSGASVYQNHGRFYSLRVMDLYSHRIFIHPQRRKDDGAVAQGLIRCWKTMGIPDFLQLDNQLCFRGSNRHPRSFGIVLRLCLSFGIEVVFIPIGEPWQNGTVESFNDTYNRRFFRTQWFRSYRYLCSQSKNFELFHNKNHRYSYLKGKTPFQTIQDEKFIPILLLRNSNFQPWTTFRREQSRSSALSGVIGNWMSLAKIFKFPKTLFTPMSGPRLLPIYIKSRSIQGMNWLLLLITNYPLGFRQVPNLGKRYPGT